MKCRDAHEMLNSYFDNKIDPMEDILLAEHIKSCPECKAELDFLIKYRNDLKTFKPVHAPDNFLTELHKRIDSENESGFFSKIYNTVRVSISSFKFPLEAAGVLALAMVVFFLYRPFFNETIRDKSSEYTIESPVEESAVIKNTGKPGSTELNVNTDKFESDYKITKEKMVPTPVKEIPKDESPLYNTADDKISLETEPPGSPKSKAENKTARSVENEKKRLSNEENSISGESGYSRRDAEEPVSLQKKSVPVTLSYPDDIFKKYDVSVIKKDLSNSDKSYYRIKIDPKRYSSFVSDLKKNSSVDIKIITRTETFNEIELFIKNNEN